MKHCWVGKADSCPVQEINAQLSCAQGSGVGSLTSQVAACCRWGLKSTGQTSALEEWQSMPGNSRSVGAVENSSTLFKSIYLFTWLCCVLVVVSGILSCGMRDVVPWPGIEPRPPALGAWRLTTRPPGRSWEQFNSWIPMVWCCHMALRDPDYFQYILTS